MWLINAADKDMEFIRELYERSFPSEERKPFSMIQKQNQQGLLELLIVTEENAPVGFVITAPGEDLVLVDYLAIHPSQQGRGLGSTVLQALNRYYEGRTIFLEIERPDPSAANQSQRLARKSFYLRNGYFDAGISVVLMGVPMELLSNRQGITFSDCEAIYDRIYGPSHEAIVKQQ